MIPSMKPYVVRAVYEWCTDQGYTPYLMVKVDEYCQVPRAYVRDGYITLNISASATKGLLMDNQWIEFTARFGGVAQTVMVPMSAVAGLFSKETQEGMYFDTTEYMPDDDDLSEEVQDQVSSQESDPPSSKSHMFKLLD